MKLDKAAAIAAILAIAVTASLYGRLPASIPIHWGFGGKPDRWGPAYTIFLLPVGALIANIATMGNESTDLRGKTMRVRLVTAILLGAEVYSFWWILSKMAG